MRILKNISILLFLLSTFYSTNAIDLTINSNQTSSCEWWTFSRTYYIPNGQSSYTRWVADEFWNIDDVYIWTTSKVWIWTSDSSLLSWCTKSTDWSRYSEVAPWNNVHVVALWANCTYNKPTNINNRNVQFVFSIKYAGITTNWTSPQTKIYTTYTNEIWKENKKTYNNYFVWTPIITHSNECLNIELRYCWDWIVSNWEVCDYNDLIKKTWWWNWGCNQTCQPIGNTTPTCNSITINPSSGNSPLTSNISCSWTNASSYKIEILNSSWAIINTINTNTWSYTFNSNWNYLAKCYINNTITSNACSAPITVWNIVTNTTCNSLTVNPVSWAPWLVSNFTCIWTNTNSYLIQIKDSTNTLIKTINTSTWSYTFNSIWNYTIECFVKDNITSTACLKNVSINNLTSCLVDGILWAWESCDPNDISHTWWWSNWCNQLCQPIWWWWWWSSPNCTSFIFGTWTWNSTDIVSPTVSPNTIRNITYIWNTLKIPITCWWNSKANYAYVDCWTNSITWNTQIIPTNQSNYTATFICEYKNNTNILYIPTCYIWGTNSSVTESSLLCTWRIAFWNNGGGWGGWGGGWGWINKCWDWIVQSPNSNWELEQCDFWAKNWTSGSLCSIDCKLGWTTWVSHWVWVITIPNNWEIILWPNDDIIIWNNINPFLEILKKPFIQNLSEFDIIFDNLCVYRKSWNSLSWQTPQCIIWKRLTPWEKIEFTSYPNFTSNINNIIWSFENNIMVTTINNLVNAYFVWVLNVKVSRPSITTLWWWTSFIKNTSKIADINKVLNNWKNKNFVWAWISNNLSSETKNLDDNNSINKATQEWDKINTTINNIINNNWVNNLSSSDINDFVKYNWISNVYIIKNTNFTINSSTNFWNWAKTYIIENGNLIINSNINYNENIAFVVKWWNIIINNSVTKINWIFISIAKNSIGWNIIWDSETKNILTVNWSVYWNIEDLINKRTYIEKVNWYLNVWTIISFGSSIFRQPAPLTWKFIWEYIDSQKVAK